MRFVSLCLVLATLGCTSAGGSLLTVDLRTDLDPAREFDVVRSELLRDSPDPAVVDVVAAQELTVSSEDDFLRGRRVAEMADVEAGAYRLRLRLLRGGTPFLERTVRVTVTESYGVIVSITRDCRGVSCPGPSHPPEHTACLAGACVPPDCAAGLGDDCPTAECATDDDCASDAACVTGACVEGICYFARDDALCAEGERCDGDLGCVSASACTPRPELCDGFDDDCDGTVDEDFDLESDALHCGLCGNACPAADGGTTRCERGVCVVECDEGRADCDGLLATGCETPLGTAEHCLSCGDRCPVDRPVCSASEGGSTLAAGCVSGCPPETPTLCASSCVDTTRDPSHCGSCETLCAFPNASALCVDGTCALGPCRRGFGDCNRITSTGDDTRDDGCETPLVTLANCGGCRTPCARANATPTCATGLCRIERCDPGFANCDANDANGCEAALGTIAHCARCGDACRLPNASSRCAMGRCEIDRCLVGWQDCNGNADDGCERSSMQGCVVTPKK